MTEVPDTDYKSDAAEDDGFEVVKRKAKPAKTPSERTKPPVRQVFPKLPKQQTDSKPSSANLSKRADDKIAELARRGLLKNKK